MFDFSLEIKGVQPITMENWDASHNGLDDNIKKSVIQYNKAIADIKANNLDSAVRNLKKALFYNRGFYEAIKLLGLCYVNRKDYKKAEKTFIKLAEYEIYSDLAIMYIKNSIIERTMTKTMNDISKVSSNFTDKRRRGFLTGSSGKRMAIAFSALVIAAFGYVMTQEAISKLPDVPKNVITADKAVDPVQAGMSEGYDSLLEDYKSIEKELNSTKADLEGYKKRFEVLSAINGIEEALMVREYEKAAVSLLDVKKMELDQESNNKIEKLGAEIKKKALWDIYNQGNRLYKEQKYMEALPKLRLAYEFKIDSGLMPWITYELGVCYKQVGDKANAVEFLQRVKSDYPKSKYASEAERQIKQIN